MDMRYPIGRYTPPAVIDSDTVQRWIDAIAVFPADLRRVVEGLKDDQLDTPYRPGGWTIRQVVHHVADSHLNAYVRFKWALTEEAPTIKAYDEKAWAELPDTRLTPPAVTLGLLDHLHARWTVLLRAMSEADWKRPYVHPDSGPSTLDVLLGLYAWHGRHHLAHITGALAQS